jgi:hypothetical protein
MLFLCPAEDPTPELPIDEDVEETGLKRKRENKWTVFFKETDRILNRLYLLARVRLDFPECIKNSTDGKIVELSCLIEYGKMAESALAFTNNEEDRRGIFELSGILKLFITSSLQIYRVISGFSLTSCWKIRARSGSQKNMRISPRSPFHQHLDS